MVVPTWMDQIQWRLKLFLPQLKWIHFLKRKKQKRNEHTSLSCLCWDLGNIRPLQKQRLGWCTHLYLSYRVFLHFYCFRGNPLQTMLDSRLTFWRAWHVWHLGVRAEARTAPDHFSRCQCRSLVPFFKACIHYDLLSHTSHASDSFATLLNTGAVPSYIRYGESNSLVVAVAGDRTGRAMLNKA